MQASQPRWTFPHSLVPALPVLTLQVAVAKYPWTDLAYSLAPNGHGGGPSRTDLYESAQAGNPLGVPKASYISALSALGTARGVFDPQIDSWNTRILGVGDPYPDADPVLLQARSGLTVERSAYYQGWAALVGRQETAVFSVSGWTDDLFEPIESFRQFKLLKRLDPRWPVAVEVADIGHSRAQNKPATWARINAAAFRFLQDNIRGTHPQPTTVSSEATVCGPGTGPVVTATTPEGLGTGTLTIAYGGGTHTLGNPLGAADPNGPAIDPIATTGDGCRTSPGPVAGGYTGVSDALSAPRTYVGLGQVTVSYTLTPAVGQAQLDARVWDVDPSGTATLVSRGTYRLDALNGYDVATGTVRLPLYGNHWSLAAGHRVRLDLTQVDSPTLRPNNQPSTITYGQPQLILPTREAETTTLSGAP